MRGGKAPEPSFSNAGFEVFYGEFARADEIFYNGFMWVAHGKILWDTA